MEVKKNLNHREEALVQENEQLRKFAYMACHDLQAPLRHINIYIKRLAKQLEGQSFMAIEENSYALSVIQSGSQKMMALVENLLTLAGVEDSPLVVGEVDLNTVCARVASTTLEGSEDHRNLNIKWGRLPVVRGNGEQILQVLMNLCSNGLKYQQDGSSPEVEISVLSDDTHWEILVADNGIGVEEKVRYNIFRPFVRLHSADEFSGTGVGLWICQRIVQKHQGKIWVSKNQEGRGSTFHWTIPKNLESSSLSL